MKVNFMLIGAMKSATTSLANMLNMHPDIFIPPIKEPTYFSKSIENRHSLEKYHSLFTDNKSKLNGDASTSYTKYPLINGNIHQELFEYNPNLKFIYIVRNPYDRILSHYKHIYEEGETKNSLHDEVFRKTHILNVTRYYTQIKPYIDIFGEENILILDFDEVTNNDNIGLNKTIEFLGLSPLNIEENIHANKASEAGRFHKSLRDPILPLKVIRKFFPTLWIKILDFSKVKLKEKPKFTQEEKLKIKILLQNEVEELSKLMNKDLSHWWSK